MTYSLSMILFFAAVPTLAQVPAKPYPEPAAARPKKRPNRMPRGSPSSAKGRSSTAARAIRAETMNPSRGLIIDRYYEGLGLGFGV